jgi:CRISPR-associated protein Csb2
VLALDVHLLGGRYDAASFDRTVPEWPPHPARAYCALVAGARDDRDWLALDWLEQQEPPDVLAAAEVKPVAREGFVVTNRTERGGGSIFHPGRRNQPYARVGSQPSAARVRFEWRAAEPDAEMLKALDSLALRVPYLGRSTGRVLASFSDTTIDTGDDLVRYHSCPLDEADTTLRVPSPGYLRRLRVTFADAQPAWQCPALAVGYQRERLTSAVVEPIASPYAQLVAVRFPGVRPDGRLAPRFTAALRTALLDRVPDPLPMVLHGHGVDDQPHVAFLALPDAGLHPRSRGHLLGLGLALPPMDDDARRAILRAFVVPDDPDHQWELDVPGIGCFAVRYDVTSPGARGMTAERWTTESRAWVTVTPFVFDRHPKKNDDWMQHIARSCVVAGYPEPAGVQVSPTALTWGAVRLAKNDLPERLRAKVVRHVRVEFDRPVRGPVLIGAGRYLGIGLFAPEDTP